MSVSYKAPLIPRWYQDEAVEATLEYLMTKGGADEKGLPIEANPLVELPTGTGKSLVNALIMKRALERHASTRALMSTHVKELIKQNAEKMQEAWPHAPLGIYSAGMKQRDTVQPIIFGGVKSMVGKYPLLGFRDFLVIDEAHLVSPDADTTYIKFINELKWGPDFDPAKHEITPQLVQRALATGRCNPFLRVIGLTATGYRLGLGHMTNGKIFTDTAYTLCTIDGFNRLMAEGFLCPLIAKPTATTLDTSGVGMTNGEFNQGALQVAVDKQDVTYKALKELVEASYNRRCGIIFAAGIEHAEHINDMMNSVFGQECVIVHSGNKDYPRTDAQNDEAFKAWKSGRVKWIVNMEKLTTGVDNPAIDVIGMFRPTMSTGLWVQMLGRGTRPLYAPGYDINDFGQRWQAIYAGGKPNCLVLDFAGNTRRLGPINDPVIPKLKGQGSAGDAPVRICPKCGFYSHASVRTCVVCGEEFDFSPQIAGKSSGVELLRSDIPVVEPFPVTRAVYTAYTAKTTGRNMIRVGYYCNLRTFFEYITVEGKPGEFNKDGTKKIDFAAKKGRDWFRQRYPGEPPETNAEVLQLMSELRPPARINVWVNKQYPEVMNYEF